MKTALHFVAAVLLGAGICFVGGLYVVPHWAMYRVEQHFIRSAGGVNQMVQGHQPNAQSKVVVRPSPNQLYSACVYDVSNGPVVIGGDVPNSYYSISLYAGNTDNFFVRDDRNLPPSYRIVLIGANASAPDGVKKSRIIRAPSTRGIVLVRLFIPRARDLQHLAKIQHTAFCSGLNSG